MADFGGFQVKTPQEVLQELQAQRQAISMIPDRQAADRANIVFQLSNAFGNPELKKARETENAIKRAEQQFETTYKGEPQSLEGQSKRLQMLYDQVKDHDPLAAAQIQTSLAAVDNERFERKRLKAQMDTSERNTKINEGRAAREAENHARAFDPSDVGYTTDPNNPGSLQTYDLTDPEHAAKYQEAAQRGLMELSQDQAYKMLGAKQARDKVNRMMNNSTFDRKLRGYDAQNQYMDKATKMINRFRVNPETGLLTMDLKRGVYNLAEEAKAIMRKEAWTDSDGNALNERVSEDFVSDKVDQMIEGGEIDIAGIDRALYKSAILNMGYILARSLDSGGRLSDQDVNMAIEMLTGGSVLLEDGTISIPGNQLVSVLYDRGLDIYSQLQPESIDGQLVKERADLGDEQALFLRTVRKQALEKFDVMDAAAKRMLPDYIYKRVRLNYDPDYLTDVERRELEFAEERAAGIKAFRNSTPSTQIFRADAEAEKAVPAGATIVYGPDGNVDRIIDTEAGLSAALKEAKPGEVFRYKNSKGEIQQLGATDSQKRESRSTGTNRNRRGRR